ncbi:GNAT family N-acetyltransferase [Streptomyces sp. NBC_00178]|uniref:GNAT family N-acetyltransferase n=1 Tax=Streptomyces sp. NBC_00178 TaxID=2975672 RepID=UPI002E2B08EF|nr:GNAT family N-acetyltransferase [Streptomyces sp. NBC_00178]
MGETWVGLELDVRHIDVDRWAPYTDRCRSAGLMLTTYAELGDTPSNRRRLYELNRDCAADIPGRGLFYTYEEYVRERVDVPSFDPRGVVLAVAGDGAWAGMAATSDRRASGWVFNEMTGMRREYRRAGVAVAMKVHGIGFAEVCGVHRVRTLHHAANTRAIAMNRMLGYVDVDAGESTV